MEIRHWICDACGRQYDHKSEMVGDICIRNGADTMILNYVCRACIRKAANLMRENFKGVKKEALPEVEPVKN